MGSIGLIDRIKNVLSAPKLHKFCLLSYIRDFIKSALETCFDFHARKFTSWRSRKASKFFIFAIKLPRSMKIDPFEMNQSFAVEYLQLSSFFRFDRKARNDLTNF